MHTRTFAEMRGLLETVKQSTALAYQVFNVVGPAQCSLAEDPETREEYLILRVFVTGSMEDILSSENRLYAELVASIPSDRLYYVRLLHSLL